MSAGIPDASTVVPVATPCTEAEAQVGALDDQGVSVWLVQLTFSRAFLVFEPTSIPPTPAALEAMAQMRARFTTEQRFALDLFGWLFAIGRVLQLYAEPKPPIRVNVLS